MIGAVGKDVFGCEPKEGCGANTRWERENVGRLKHTLSDVPSSRTRAGEDQLFEPFGHEIRLSKSFALTMQEIKCKSAGRWGKT